MARPASAEPDGAEPDRRVDALGRRDDHRHERRDGQGHHGDGRHEREHADGHPRQQTDPTGLADEQVPDGSGAELAGHGGRAQAQRDHAQQHRRLTQGPGQPVRRAQLRQADGVAGPWSAGGVRTRRSATPRTAPSTATRIIDERPPTSIPGRRSLVHSLRTTCLTRAPIPHAGAASPSSPVTGEPVRWKKASSSRRGTTPSSHSVMPLRIVNRFNSPAQEAGELTSTRPSIATADRPACSHSRTSSPARFGPPAPRSAAADVTREARTRHRRR